MISLRIALAFFLCFFIGPSFASTVSPKSAPLASLALGFSVTKDGYILTTAQLVDARPVIIVRRPTESIQRRARLIAIDRKLDLALLKINAVTVEIPIGNWNTVIGGQNVSLFGFSSPTNPKQPLVITPGVIELQAAPPSVDSIFSISMARHRGSPGGPVLSIDGSVVGVVNSPPLGVSGSSTSLDQSINAVNAFQLKRFFDQQKVKYTIETTAQTPLKAVELLKKYEESIFLIEVGTDDFNIPEKKSFRRKGADEKLTTELPERLRGLIKILPEREQPRLFGAYKAGYDLIEEWDDSYMLIKSDSRKVEVDSETKIIKFDSIISYKKERTLSSGEPYLSVIMTARFNCTALTIDIIRQEFKPETYGSGKSIVAKKRMAEAQAQWATIKSDRRRDSMKTAVCESESPSEKKI